MPRKKWGRAEALRGYSSIKSLKGIYERTIIERYTEF